MTRCFHIGLSLLLVPLISPAWAYQDDDREDPLARFEQETNTYLDLWRRGEYAESLKFLENAIVTSTDGVPMRWLYDRAELQFVQGRVDEAISEIEWLHYRRPSPKSALQLALFHKGRGNLEEFRRTLERAANRYRRFKGEKDDTENTIAIIRIRELLGENPRSLFQELGKIEDDDPEDRVRVHLAAGNLAWRKFDYDLASKEYEKAMAIDGDNQEVLSGLAECYWKSGDPRLEGMMDSVLSVNPRHPRMLSIRAEMSLDAGDTEAALKDIETVLAINPNHMTFMGLKAAAYFLEDRLGEMTLTQQRALLYNRTASEVYRIPGRVAARHYRFAEGAEQQRKALLINEDDHVARALLAFDLLRMGEDQEGREQLERSFEADRFNVQVYNMLNLLDTLETFETVKRGPFVLKMPKRERVIWGDEAMDLLLEAHKHFEKEYDVDLEEPIHVQIFDNHDDFMVRSVGLPGSVGYLGICFGKLITMDTPSARHKGTLNWRATLWHEFVHVVTLQKTNNRMPRWLSEGISVYEEIRRDPAWGQRPDPNYKVVVNDGDIPKLNELELYFTQPKSQFHVVFGYYMGGEFVRFYTQAYGHQALVDALAAIGKGDDTVEALLEASGAPADDLNTAFRAHMEQLLEPYKNLPNPEPTMTDRLMGNGGAGAGGIGGAPFASAMKKGDEAMAEGRYEDAERWFTEADALFPGMVGPKSPLNMLATLYEIQDDDEKHTEILERLFAIDGTGWQVCHALGKQYKASENWQGLQEVAHRGLGIDPFDVSMRRALRDAHVSVGDRKKALEALDVLIRLDPDQRFDYRLQRVDLHMDEGRWERARGEVLTLLEEIPYSWEAQRRLLEAKDKKRGSSGKP